MSGSSEEITQREEMQFNNKAQNATGAPALSQGGAAHGGGAGSTEDASVGLDHPSEMTECGGPCTTAKPSVRSSEFSQEEQPLAPPTSSPQVACVANEDTWRDSPYEEKPEFTLSFKDTGQKQLSASREVSKPTPERDHTGTLNSTRSLQKIWSRGLKSFSFTVC